MSKKINIDEIMEEYTERVGESYDKSRDLGKLYAKRPQKTNNKRYNVRCLAPALVCTVLLLAIVGTLPFIERLNDSYLEYTNGGGNLFGSLKGDKGDVGAAGSVGGNKGDGGGNKNDQSGNGDKDEDGAGGNSHIPEGEQGANGVDGPSKPVKSDTVLLGQSFFTDRTVPKVECSSISVQEIDIENAPEGLFPDRFCVTLLIWEGDYLAATLNYVREDVSADEFEAYKNYSDKAELHGFELSYRITRLESGLYRYSMHFNEEGADCYVDIYESVQKEIDEVLTDFFG